MTMTERERAHAAAVARHHWYCTQYAGDDEIKILADLIQRERAAARAEDVASATAVWTRELPTQPGKYWNAFRWPSTTRELYPTHSTYMVQIVTVFDVTFQAEPESTKLYVKGMLPACSTLLDDITKYEYDVWWMPLPTPAPPPPL